MLPVVDSVMSHVSVVQLPMAMPLFFQTYDVPVGHDAVSWNGWFMIAEVGPLIEHLVPTWQLSVFVDEFHVGVPLPQSRVAVAA